MQSRRAVLAALSPPRPEPDRALPQQLSSCGGMAAGSYPSLSRSAYAQSPWRHAATITAHLWGHTMAQPFAEPCSRGLISAEPCPRELGRETTPARRRMVLAACVVASSMAFI